MPNSIHRHPFRERVGKAFQMVFSGWFGQNWPGWKLRTVYPGSQFDYEKEVGDPWLNGAVGNGIGWIQTVFPEARLQVTRLDGQGKPQPVVDHPLVTLLRLPNDQYSGNTLWKATILSWVVSGNSYWIVARGMGGLGGPRSLWWVPHYSIAPQWDVSGKDFIENYKYRVDGKIYTLPYQDVIHLRCGMDPYNTRLGLGPLTPVLREIFADNEASTYTAALLRNFGVPGSILSPKVEGILTTQGQVDEYVDQYVQQTTGENRGRPIMSNIPVDVTQLGFSPEAMALDKLRSIPELRIAGALHVPAALLQFQAGLDKSTYANMKEFSRQGMESCIIPMQREMADDLFVQLLPYLGDPKVETVSWDYSQVAALQPDQDALHKRAVTSYQGGVTKRSEARAILALESTPDDDVYFTDLSPGTNPDLAADQAQAQADIAGNAGTGKPKPGGGGSSQPDAEGNDGSDAYVLPAWKALPLGRMKAAADDDEGGHWVTINGNAVFIGTGGEILKGPAALVGKNVGGNLQENEKAGKEAKENPAHPDHEKVVNHQNDHLKLQTKGGQRPGFHHATEAEAAHHVLPPAWTGKQVADDPNARLTAVGKDTKDRQQYRYSTAHSEAQSEAKFGRAKAYAKDEPGLTARAKTDMEGDGPDKEAAAALYLISQTGFRVGGSGDTGAEKEAFGATTLQADHAKVEGDTVHFAFTGKKGVAITKTLKDADIAKDIQARQAADPHGPLYKTNDAKVRDYLHKIDGEFKVKDYRTFHGTTEARNMVQSMEAPTTKTGFEKARKQVGEAVAKHLGNTATVALASYIDPAVFDEWSVKS